MSSQVPDGVTAAGYCSNHYHTNPDCRLIPDDVVVVTDEHVRRGIRKCRACRKRDGDNIQL